MRDLVHCSDTADHRSLHPDPDFDCERCHAEGRACEILWWLKPEHERLLDEEGMDDPTVGSTLINPGDEGTSTDEDMDDVNLDVGWAGWLGGRARACSACAASDKKKKCSWSGKSVRVIWDYMPFTPWAQPVSCRSRSRNMERGTDCLSCRDLPPLPQYTSSECPPAKFIKHSHPVNPSVGDASWWNRSNSSRRRIKWGKSEAKHPAGDPPMT